MSEQIIEVAADNRTTGTRALLREFWHYFSENPRRCYRHVVLHRGSAWLRCWPT